MNMPANIPATLLPSGFQDVLSPFAAQESEYSASLLKLFKKQGFEQVKPPLLEPRSTFHGQPCFEVTDPQTGESLAIRPDITPQVARLAALRLKERARPLKLCYGGQVVRPSGIGLARLRQLAQAGCEQVGDVTPQTITRMMQLALEGLQQCGVENITLDCALPGLAALIVAQDHDLSSAWEAIQQAIAQRDVTALCAHGVTGEKLAGMIQSAGAVERAAHSLEGITLPAAMQHGLQAIMLLAENLPAKVSVTLDPLDNQSSAYHEGFRFTCYSKHHRDALGHGGTYALPQTGEPACGFSLSITSILQKRV